MLCKFNLFIPKHNPVKESDIKLLCNFLIKNQRILALTGAGISTESGIPDYRSEGIGMFARRSKIITYQDFITNRCVRQGYWARNFVGWPRFSSVEPNYNHRFLKELEPSKITCVITQNVDNLHFKAESRNVIELHGSKYKVVCLKCPYEINQYHFQNMLAERNVHLNIDEASHILSNGDINIPPAAVKKFIVPPCPNCGSILKPNIVFYGEDVPLNVINSVDKEISNCDSVLVLGSTLATYSSYRIVLEAEKLRKPISVVNIGNSRASRHAEIQISAKISEVLSKVKQQL